MRSDTVAVFDSGIGGLTVVKELFSLHAGLRIVYFGDTARVPYGSKSVATIRRYAAEDTELLLRHEPSVIVVACNTVSAVALDVVREIAKEIPVIGMIEPACSEALRVSKTGKIGVIGTEATIASNAYEVTLREQAGHRSIEIISVACPLFVPLAEEGWQDHEAARLVAQEYLAPLVAANIDVLILGCTHYPVLKNVIQQIMGSGVMLINSGEASAKLVPSDSQHSEPREHILMVSDIPRKFQLVGERFLGYPMPPVKQVIYNEVWVAA